MEESVSEINFAHKLVKMASLNEANMCYKSDKYGRCLCLPMFFYTQVGMGPETLDPLLSLVTWWLGLTQ